MENNIMNIENWKGVHVDVELSQLHNENVLRVVKSEKIYEFDENTYAKLVDTKFHNGVIEVKIYSRLLENAPDFARGFIGIAYRIQDDDTKFESFYVRPTNGRRCHDSIRKAHGCQYFSYPMYTFSYFREHQITTYEAPVDIDIEEWITLKAVIEEEQAKFYINDSENPVLTVEQMKHGASAKGSIGLFVDIGTEAFFKDLSIVYYD